jgi:organic hydroperoxide reductase OsmC/OhrA
MASQLPLYYTSEVIWTGDKKGRLSSPGLPELQVATPPEFDGHEGIWSPEHYFVAAVNSCLMTTFLAIAQMSKLEFVSFSAEATGKVDKPEGQGYQLTELVIRPKVVVRHIRDVERAGRILAKAEKHCIISNSIKSTVKLEPEVASADE